MEKGMMKRRRRMKKKMERKRKTRDVTTLDRGKLWFATRLHRMVLSAITRWIYQLLLNAHHITKALDFINDIFLNSLLIPLDLKNVTIFNNESHNVVVFIFLLALC